MKLLKNLQNKLNGGINALNLRNTRKSGAFVFAFFFLLSAVFSGLFTSCKDSSKHTVVIWTNCSEIVPYAEVFNTSQNKVKALVVYKKNPAESLPAAKDEIPPDLVIGSLMRTERKRKQFRSLTYMFTTGEVNESQFYGKLLDSCKKNDAVLQIPVSFNIPAAVFATTNKKYVKEDYLISFDQMKSYAIEYNKKNKNGFYTQMGFAPQWYPEFLYTFARMEGGNFAESGISFSWNEKSLAKAETLLKSWTEEANHSSVEEQDFAFKYLYTPPYKQLMSEHCLFAYMPSNKLFAISKSQRESLDFRWIQNNNKIPVEDSMITLGLYHKALHKENAEQFIKWFFTEDSQRKMLEHVKEMNLNTSTFGIAGGFSSLKSVNEKIFPIYYTDLLSNIPVGDYLEPPAILPLRWESLKEKVIIPYLSDSISLKNESGKRTVEERISDWSKQFF